MYYYTISITPEGLQDVINDLTERINAFSKRRKPFRVVAQEEQLDKEMAAMVVRFHLVVVPDFVVKNERQSWTFCEQLHKAAEEIAEMNACNYIIVPPPSKSFGGMRH